jgi:hypothetical protein
MRPDAEPNRRCSNCTAPVIRKWYGPKPIDLDAEPDPLGPFIVEHDQAYRFEGHSDLTQTRYRAHDCAPLTAALTDWLTRPSPSQAPPS